MIVDMTHTETLSTPELLHLRVFRSGKNQRQAAESLGISNATLSRIVNGVRKPTATQKRNISKRYRIKVSAWS